MMNRLDTAVVRSLRQVEYLRLIQAAGATQKGTVYHPTHGQIVGFNFGTSVRPEVAPITVANDGHETLASFLARGGRIVKGAPKVARGAVLVNTITSRPTRVAVSRG